MTVSIQNLTEQRVLLRFNSGLTRYLTPHETLENIEAVEIKGNRRIQHLEARHAIAVGRSSGGRPPRSGDMNAADAIKHIKATPLEALQNFLSPDEARVTVVDAMKEKRGD